MTAANLVFSSAGVPYADETKGINYYKEIPGNPAIEVFRVTTDYTGDYFYSRFNKIKAVLVQTHGATFATGVDQNPPKIVVTQGSSTSNAKVTITHTNTAELMSFFIIGDL